MPARILCLMLSSLILACGSKPRAEPPAPLPQSSPVERSQDPSVSDPATGELLLDGKVLYDLNCATCHGPLEQSSAARASTPAIQTALQNILEMQSLPALQEKQLDSLAQAMSRIPPGKSKGKP